MLLELYRKELWSSWVGTSSAIEELDPTKFQDAMFAKISDYNSFDGGRIAGWVTAMEGPAAVLRSVRDRRTGHTIHCYSDRPRAALTHDLLFGLRILAWMSSATPITWWWWDQPWPRTLPADTDPGKDHVNGGWAVPGIPEVHVYRREEAHKVLIHECIHALLLDVAVATEVRSQFNADLGRRLWPHLGEAYTELYAEWLWSIAAASSLTNACKAWSAQLRCSERQAIEVWVRIHDSRVDEDTNVFAYYVLKWVLMQHLEEALMRPQHAFGSWFRWWLELKPRLGAAAMAPVAVASEHKALSMGMTCGASGSSGSSGSSVQKRK